MLFSILTELFECLKCVILQYTIGIGSWNLVEKASCDIRNYWNGKVPRNKYLEKREGHTSAKPHSLSLTYVDIKFSKI